MRGPRLHETAMLSGNKALDMRKTARVMRVEMSEEHATESSSGITMAQARVARPPNTLVRCAP